jgi:hypothetical protein
MDDIATAYGVSKRTAYRYLAADVAETVVELVGWRATFAVVPGRAPWRVTRWRRV